MIKEKQSLVPYMSILRLKKDKKTKLDLLNLNGPRVFLTLFISAIL